MLHAFYTRVMAPLADRGAGRNGEPYRRRRRSHRAAAAASGGAGTGAAGGSVRRQLCRKKANRWLFRGRAGYSKSVTVLDRFRMLIALEKDTVGETPRRGPAARRTAARVQIRGMQRAAATGRGPGKRDILAKMSPQAALKGPVFAIGQVAITVRHMDRAVAFYRDVLCLSFLFETDTMAFFDCGGTRLTLGPAENGDSTWSSIIYYKTVDIQESAQMLGRAAFSSSRSRG